MSTKQSVAVVIPARYESSRLPGKPLLPIAGMTMIERVWRIARSVQSVQRVIVATDDERILTTVESFGGEAILTDPRCKNGTERVHAALAQLTEQPDAVVNFQGDAAVTPPWILEALVTALQKSECDIVTPAVQLATEEYADFVEKKRAGSTSGTLVVFNEAMRALYFSNALIPFIRRPDLQAAKMPVYRHIGMYGYTIAALEKYLSFPESPLERLEGLEQLRALEHGMSIEVVPVSYQGRSHASVDNPEDVATVEAIIAREGELLP